ncbi:MAG TPA: sigma-70 family RNA polymerase sigma factor [Thermoleophilaceae bacterium]|jgi:RNA polymerase sigma-70 factor (ECF subfamily)|nr:sigma-70 family RNA polymerase sigma factor [Thermoleophilaceae bacterium]
MATAREMRLSDAEIVEALKRGDEAVFAQLVDAWSPSLMRMARMFVRDRAVAEEVVQETWLAVVRGIDRFEGRSSLRTWVFRILMNTAKTRGQREARSVPFSAAAHDDEPAVDPDRFLDADHRWAGGWMLGPSEWQTPEEELLGAEARQVILDAIDELPESQRVVITMRDVEGFPPDEVSEALGITDGNQRVLLHRARSKVRAAIEAHLGAIEPNRAALEPS